MTTELTDSVPPEKKASEPTTITKPTKFRDTEGREWAIVLKSSTLEKLKQAHQVDLWNAADLSESGPLVKLNDERKLLAVLWDLCAVQAEAEGVSREQFEDAIAGDVFDAAFDAITGALFVFFSGARRSMLQVALEGLTGMAAKQVEYTRELQAAGKAKEREVLDDAKRRYADKAAQAAKSKIAKFLNDLSA